MHGRPGISSSLSTASPNTVSISGNSSSLLCKATKITNLDHALWINSSEITAVLTMCIFGIGASRLQSVNLSHWIASIGYASMSLLLLQVR